MLDSVVGYLGHRHCKLDYFYDREVVRAGISLYSVAIGSVGSAIPCEPGMIRIAAPSLRALAIWARRQFPNTLPPARKRLFDKKVGALNVGSRSTPTFTTTVVSGSSAPD